MKLRFYHLSLIALFLLVACTETIATPTPRIIIEVEEEQPEIFNIRFWQAPETLNPHLTVSDNDLQASRIVYEPLASFDNNGELVPILASSIPSLEDGTVSGDGRSVTWTLKRNVQWADGAPFTSADVQFTFDYVRSLPDTGATLNNYSNVSQVEIVNDYTVTVHFDRPTPIWYEAFVGIKGVIIPKHLFQDYMGEEAVNASNNELAIGTGAYYTVSNDPQAVLLLGYSLVKTNKIVFEPNPYFREADKPFFDQVILSGGETVEEVARLVLQEGSADFAINLTLAADELEALEEEGVGELVIVFGDKVEQLAFNHTDPNVETADGERSNLANPHPFLSDVRVRQAIRMAIDRKRIDQLYGSIGRPTNNNLVAPPRMVSPNTDIAHDPGAAAALLDEAGWVDTDGDGIRDNGKIPMNVVYLAPQSTVVIETQLIVQENLEAIGIDVELKPVQSTVFYDDDENTNSGLLFYADFAEYSIRSGNPDPTEYMSFWLCDRIPQKSNNWSAGFNLSRWCDPTGQYDELYQKTQSEIDPTTRQQLFIAMNDLFVDQAVTIPLVHLADVSAVSNDITGLSPTPWDGFLWDLKDWRRISDDEE